MEHCECCGAPVGPDGRWDTSEEAQYIEEELERYEAELAAGSVTDDGERYEPGPGARSVTDDLAELRKKYPHGHPGSKPWWRHRRGHEEGCVICGDDLPANLTSSWSGRKTVARHRMYCSNACRQKAYRIRKKVRANENGKEE